MKRLDVSWDGVYDSTGYLFSFAKSVCAEEQSLGGRGRGSCGIQRVCLFRMWVSPALPVSHHI